MMNLINLTEKEMEACTICHNAWTLKTSREKYCGDCNSHIIILEDEVYHTLGWQDVTSR